MLLQPRPRNFPAALFEPKATVQRPDIIDSHNCVRKRSATPARDWSALFEPGAFLRSPFGNDELTRVRKPKVKRLYKKQAARMEAREESLLQKSIKQANHQGELALVHGITEYSFFGQIIVQSREEAIATASTFSTPIPNRLVLFTDGSAFSLVKDQNGTRVRKGFGATVVYQIYKTGERWNELLYRLKGDPDIDRSEYTAVAEALAIALPWALRKLPTLEDAQGCQVVIFTDSQSALSKLERLGTHALTEDMPLRTDSVRRKLITRSQYLRQLGVRVDVRWVPAHAKVEGNERADAAARRAGKGVHEVVPDEGLEMIEAGLTTLRSRQLLDSHRKTIEQIEENNSNEK